MDVQLGAVALKNGLKGFANICSGGTSSIEALKCILLETGENTITLSGTNLSIAGREQIPAILVRLPGKALIPYQAFNSFVSALGESAVDITDISKTGDGTLVKISEAGGKARTSIRCIPVDELPAIPEVSADTELCSVPASEFLQAFGQAAKAAAKDASRPVLQSVYLHANTGLELVGVDGHRLHILEVGAEVDGDKTLLVPGIHQKALGMFDAKGDELHLSESASMLSIRQKTRELLLRLMDGTFPDFRRIVPTSTARQFTVNVADLQNAIGKVLAPVKYDIGDAPLVVVLGQADESGYATLSLHIKAGGAASESANEIMVKANPGDEVIVGLSPKYLDEALDCFESASSVAIGVSGRDRPVLLTATGVTAVIMPMWVKGKGES